MFLVAVMDLYSRQIIGWSLWENLEEGGPLQALAGALIKRGHPRQVIHHSDRGIQYASWKYRQQLERSGLIASMSRKGNCYDNAAIEAFWSTLNSTVHNVCARQFKKSHKLYEWSHFFTFNNPLFYIPSVLMRRDTFFRSNRHRDLLFFASLLILFAFITFVYVFDVRELSQHSDNILAVFVALFGASLGSTLPGKMHIVVRRKSMRLEASSGFAIMALILLWWKSDLTPIRSPERPIRIREKLISLTVRSATPTSRVGIAMPKPENLRTNSSSLQFAHSNGVPSAERMLGGDSSIDARVSSAIPPVGAQDTDLAISERRLAVRIALLNSGDVLYRTNWLSIRSIAESLHNLVGDNFAFNGWERQGMLDAHIKTFSSGGSVERAGNEFYLRCQIDLVGEKPLTDQAELYASLRRAFRVSDTNVTGFDPNVSGFTCQPNFQSFPALAGKLQDETFSVWLTPTGLGFRLVQVTTDEYADSIYYPLGETHPNPD
jgi:hypothetical protein